MHSWKKCIPHQHRSNGMQEKLDKTRRGMACNLHSTRTHHTGIRYRNVMFHKQYSKDIRKQLSLDVCQMRNTPLSRGTRTLSPPPAWRPLNGVSEPRVNCFPPPLEYAVAVVVVFPDFETLNPPALLEPVKADEAP